jgi:excisionase family DNA binding protein
MEDATLRAFTLTTPPLSQHRPWTDDGDASKHSLLLTAKQVARMLGISPRQVLRLPIPQVRLGHRTIRYRKEDVDAFIEQSLSGY